MAKIVRLFHASPLNTQRNSRRNEHTLFRGVIHSKIFETARTICHHYHPGPLHVICNAISLYNFIYDFKLHETRTLKTEKLWCSVIATRTFAFKAKMQDCEGSNAKV